MCHVWAVTRRSDSLVSAGKALREAVLEVGHIKGLVMRPLLHPGNDHLRFAEVRLRLARRVGQRHEHLVDGELRLPYIVLHDGVTTRVAMLGREPLKICLAVCRCFAASAAAACHPQEWHR